MNTFEQIVNQFELGITVVSVFINIVVFILFLKQSIDYFFNIRILKSVLGYKKNATVNISQSIFTPEMLHISRTMITYNSAICLSKIISIFEKCNQKYKAFGELPNSYYEMHIGGPLSNKAVNTYIINHFPNFKFCALEKNKDDNDTLPLNTDVIEYVTDSAGFHILSNDTFLKIDNDVVDFAFVIKLTAVDFNNSFKKSVHIMFGGYDIGTLKAVEFFETYFKEIYNKYKKNHYFIAIPVNKINGTYNFAEGIIDLTEHMF